MKNLLSYFLFSAVFGGHFSDIHCIINQKSHIVKSWVNNKVSSTALFGEMRILIHGTKNAWTTLRPYDLVLYELEIKVKGKERGLGVYTPDREVLPLCNYEKGSTEFYVDTFQEAYSAETLKSENRLLRIVSADRRGTGCFVVEEYLDNDILISVRDPQIQPAEQSPPSESSSTSKVQDDSTSSSGMTSSVEVKDDEKLSESVEKLISKIEAAKYDQQLLLLKSQREVSNLEVQLANLHKKKAALTSSDSPSTSQQNKQIVVVESTKAPKAVGPYSQAVRANGFVFVSGCVGLNMETGRIADGGVEAEVRQTLENLKCIIEQSGSSLSKACKITIMMREMSYFAEVNKIYAEYFNLNGGATALPARSTFEVSFLPLGAFIEIDAICLE
jgi:2-iminobutanoate/2-iminopropanoate deaminase